jgi:carbamoylphosphate synthase large subunit
MKTILFLGASQQQLPPIEYARCAGHRIVTCDNRPTNPGHSIADSFHNISTIERPEVLNVARKEQIDAVVCYASDISAPTAAYVSERMGLPGNPFVSVEILTNKAKFREFQVARGYYTPKHVAFAINDVLDQITCVKRVLSELELPLIVKPVDASGSKGVTKIYDENGLIDAINRSMAFSQAKGVIIEQLVAPLGFQVCGEGFLQEGKIIFFALANEHFTTGITVPIGESFPAMFSEDLECNAYNTIQQIMFDLGMKLGAFNFDLMFLNSGEVFVIEIGPRNGGNGMPEAIRYAYQVDTISATVEAALGEQVQLSRKSSFYCSTYSIHSKRDGVLNCIRFSSSIQNKILAKRLFFAPGERVQRFTMGNLMLGNLILVFETYAEMLQTMSRMDEHILVDVKD